MSRLLFQTMFGVVRPQRVIASVTLVVLMLLVLVTDSFTQLGFAHGYLYIPIILLASAIARMRMVVTVTCCALIFNWLGFFISPETNAELAKWYILANRTLAFIIIGTTYVLLHLISQAQNTAEYNRRAVAQKNYFQDLSDALPVMVWTAKPDGSLAYVGSQLIDTTGRSSDYILDNWTSLLHPDDLERTLKIWAQSLASGESYAVEFRIRNYKGNYVWMLTQAKPKLNSEGQIEAWYGSCSDITETRRLRDEAGQSAKRLHQTLESITDSFFTLDRDFQFTYVNRRATTVLQHSAYDILQSRLSSESSFGFDEEIVARLQAVMQEQQPDSFQTFYQPLQIWLEIRCYPNTDTLAVYVRDITSQRKEQEQLKLLRTAVSRLNDVIIITEAEPVQEPGPRVVFVNEAFERKTGYTANEILGKTPRILQGPGTQGSELDKIRAALKKWQSVRAKVLNYTKDGREIWLELDIVPIADDTGWYTHWVAVERDVTREHRMEQQLQQVQRLESISHLTGGIAHDFNNLLTVVLGNADMLCETLTDDAQRQLAETIVKASERGATLTNSLLAFARRQTLNPKQFAVDTILNDLAPLIRTAIGSENKLFLKIHSQLPSIFIDRAQLENALLNLATNSKQAMPGNGEFTIEAQVTELDEGYLDLHPDLQPGSYMLLKVSDNGHGIPAKDIKHIFEPFFSRRDDNSGTGLGLSMVFGFVKQSGGHISVCSEINQGTTFCLYLPLTDSVLAAEEPDNSVPLAASTQLTILVVEDETPIRQLAVNYLTSEGFQVLQAEHAAQALEICDTEANIDFLFSDISMPGEHSGIELAEVFAERYPQAGIVLTSGFAEKANTHKKNQGNTPYPVLPKPYRKDQLIRYIHQVLSANTP
ncbi:MAG: PAS domain S-box protein [Idiomarina sp.]